MFVAGYFIRGARLGYAFHRRRIRVHLRRGRDSWTAANASTWTAAEIHVHTTTACLALSAVCVSWQRVARDISAAQSLTAHAATPQPAEMVEVAPPPEPEPGKV